MLEEMLKNVREKSPLIHNITNYVTVNDCANVVLACGASPIMADDQEEVAEIKRPVRRSEAEELEDTTEETWEKPEEPVRIKRPVRNKPRRFEPKHESERESDGHESSGYESDEEELSKGEKIALYVVGALLIAVIIVIVVILLKIKG